MTDYAVKTEFRGVDHMSEVLKRIQTKAAGATSGIRKTFDDLGKANDRALSKANNLAKGVAVGAVAAGAGLAFLSAPALDFEQTLANISAVAKPTSAELARISETAQTVGSEMGFAGGEVASSMEAMLKQGVPLQGVLKGIGGVAAAAAADGSTLDETMGGLLATMAGLGEGPEALQHMADVMAKAGDATAASIGSLNASMAVFGPTARSLNIPIESAVGQLAILQDAGLDASSAGTTLSAVYSKLSAPMGRTQKALAKLGIEVRDLATGDMKKPAQLLNEIFSATSKIKGNVGKSAAITELVGLESQKALLNLTGAVGSGKFDEVMKSLETGVDGYSKSIAKIKQDSTRGDTAKLAATFDALRISMFSLVSGPLRGLISGFTEWVSANKDSAVAGVQSSFEWLKVNLPTIVTWLERVGKVGATFLAFSLIVKGVTLALAAMNAVASANPYVLLTLAIVGAIGAIWAFWPEISSFFGKLWGGIKDFAGRVYSALAGAVTAVVSPIRQLFVGAFQVVLGLATMLVRAMWPVIAPIGQFFGSIAEGVKQAWSSVGTFFSGLWTSIVSAAGTVWEGIVGVSSGIKSRFMEVWGGVSSFFEQLWQGIVSAFNTYVQPIIDKVAAVVDSVGKFIGGAKALGSAVASGTEGVAPPAERIGRQISESRTSNTERSELVVKAPPGSKLKGESGSLTTLKLKKTGDN